jgi:hypothetical protein
MPENDDEIFEATPRAPLAAVAIAAIAAPWIDAVSLELGAAAISDGIGCVPDGAAGGGAAALAASAAGDLVDHGDGAADD